MLHGSPKKLRIGISTCLLGEKVRFDGQHKKDDFLLRLLGPHVEWVPVCPEVEAGMPIPREPIRLIKRKSQVRVVTVKTEIDVTEQLTSYSEKKVRLIKKENLCGFILKKGSPSCGMERVKCYTKKGHPERDHQGVFAQHLMKAHPNLPIEEEGRLKDAALRENFIERLFAYHRLKALFSSQWTRGQLVTFHSNHKLQLLAHSPADHRALGRIVAKAKSLPRKKFEKDYTTLFMSTLKKRATVGRNTNTLEHMAGHFKKSLDPKEKKELAQVLKDYRSGWVPLVVPVTLIKHYVHKFDVSYLKGQSYLEPNPREMMLRNHV